MTLKELHIANRNDSGSGLLVRLLFIPIANWFAGWHYCKELALFTNEKYPRLRMFLLWVFFSPAVWFMSQR